MIQILIFFQETNIFMWEKGEGHIMNIVTCIEDVKCAECGLEYSHEEQGGWRLRKNIALFLRSV